MERASKTDDESKRKLRWIIDVVLFHWLMKLEVSIVRSKSSRGEWMGTDSLVLRPCRYTINEWEWMGVGICTAFCASQHIPKGKWFLSNCNLKGTHKMVAFSLHGFRTWSITFQILMRSISFYLESLNSNRSRENIKVKLSVCLTN
jgi:hypothetical protein